MILKKVPHHKNEKGMLCVYEEDYIDYLGHRYDRSRSKFNGEPLYKEGEISVPQCAKLLGIPNADIYYRVYHGMIPHERRGHSIILKYDDCVNYFTRKDERQLELMNE